MIVSVFGGSRCRDAEPAYTQARELGAALAQAGFAVATGGYGGTMEAVSRGAAEAGGHVIGVVAKVFSGTGNRWVKEEIVVPQWEDRLLRLIAIGDAYIALPGGTGTLVELAVAWEMMHKRLLAPKPLVALGDFWSPIVAHIEAADDRCRGIVSLANSIPEALQELRAKNRRGRSKRMKLTWQTLRRMMVCVLVGFAVLSVAGVQEVHAQGGPPGGIVNSLAIDPSTLTTLYAGTQGGGVFKSINGGMSWAAASSGLPPNRSVGNVAIDPTAPATLYVGVASNGIYKSTDGGMSWEPANSGLPAFSSGGVRIDSSNTATLYAATGSGVFKSINGGVSWTDASVGLPLNRSISALAIDPSNPNTLYAGNSLVSPGSVIEIFKSTDGATSWTSLSSSLATTGINALAIDPSASATVYAATNNRVIKSTNGGMTWNDANSGMPYPTTMTGLAIDPSAPSTLYAGGSNGELFRSTNAATSWTALNTGLAATPDNPNGKINALVITSSIPSTLYIATNGFGVLKSTSGGTNWIAANSGLGSAAVAALAIDPFAPATLYVGADGTIFKSINGGVSWTDASSGLPGTDITTLAIDPSTPATLYAGTIAQGVYKSVNGGASWTAARSGLPNTSAFALAIDPSAPATIYAGTAGAGTAGGGVFKSTNGGTSWTAVNSGLPDPGGASVFVLVIDPSTSSTLYAVVQGNGLYKTTNGGVSWVDASSSIPNKIFISTVAVDPLISSTLYVALSTRELFKSTDGGINWTAASSGLPATIIRALAIDPSNPATVYASGDGSIFKSTDGGMNWTTVKSGLGAVTLHVRSWIACHAVCGDQQRSVQEH